MINVPMVKHLIQVLSLTWLFWLYFSTSLLTISKPAASPQTASHSLFKPFNLAARAIAISTKLNAERFKHSWDDVATDLLDSDRNEDWAQLEISLKYRRLTLYRGNNKIKSYPIAIGQLGWETPTGQFQIIDMQESPTWINPLTNQVIPGDHPKNPLGHFWIAFYTDGHKWIGFHGTPNPETVGQAASHGCIRMYNADVEELYYQVSTGTPVFVTR
jgi:hypothetical protein